jgi:WD40 repeat protein/Tfp pilus assembly protein PilF
VRILTGRSEKVRAVSFNQDGDIVAAEGNQLCVWESHSGELQKQMITHEDPIVDVACSCDFVVSATGDGHVIIWSDGAEYDELFYPGPLYAVACSRQKNLLAACEDQAIKLWDIEGGDEILLEGHTASVRKCAFSPDDALIVSYGDDQTLRTWDVLRGEERARTKTSETVVALGWMESGRDAVAICASGSLMSWDIDSQEPPTLVKVCASPVTIGAISEDGRLAIIATAQREIILWDVQDSEKVCHIHNLSSQIVSCAISPEGDMLVVGLEDTSLELRQVKNGLVDKTIGGHSDQILDCDITGDGALIASASMDGTAKLWDGLTGRDLATLRDHSGSVTAAAFSPEGLNLATGDYDGHVRIWDFEAWDHYRIGAWEDDDAPEIGLNAMFPRWTDENIDDLAYSPKNGFLVAAANGVIKVLSEFEQDIAADLQSGGHACFFSPDGTSILTVSSNQTYLWDAETFELIKSFPRGEYICGISRDADWIINGDRSYGLSIWSLRTGREVIRFFMQDWPVSLAVCPVRDEFAITGYFAELRILRYHISPSAEVEDRRRTTPPRDREEPQRTTEFDTAALISPEDLIQSGKGAMDQGDIAGALDYFEQAVEVLPDDLDALSYRVTALLRLGKNEEALVQLDGILDRNLALGPNLACMYVGKAKALTGLGRNADALHFYDRALALVDDDRNIWFSRGHVFYLMEQYEHALENFQRANALSEEEKTTEFIGWSLLGARRYLKSENIFAMLISRGPRDPLSWYGLALSENELNKKVQARTHLERFIQEARPEHAGILPQARGILRNLRRDEG